MAHNLTFHIYRSCISPKSHLVAAIISALVAAIAGGVAVYSRWYQNTARIMGEGVNFEAIDRAHFYGNYCVSLAGFAFIIAVGFLWLFRSSTRRQEPLIPGAVTIPTRFRTENWTPRALKALATAKKLAASTGRITAHHLLLALDDGDSFASRILRDMSITPSAASGRSPSIAVLPDVDLFYEDFDVSLREIFPRVAFEESKSMGDSYVGTEHLLLMLARCSAPGVDLPYERIRDALRETRTTS